MIKVLIVSPHEEPKVATIDSSFNTLRKVVSIGSYELVNVRSKKVGNGVYIVYADDGILYDLEPNKNVGNEVICGTVIVLAVNSEGYATSLTDYQVNKYTKLFSRDEKLRFSDAITSWSKKYERELEEMSV